MDCNQILKQELDEKTGYESEAITLDLEYLIKVYNSPYDSINSLTFSIMDGLLILVEECYYAGDHSYVNENCAIIVGKSTVDNIINTMNIFIDHGRENNKNNPSMKKLLLIKKLINNY